MSPEAQRIAIAKACGWRKVREATDWHMQIHRFEGIEPGSKRSQIYRQRLPDYLNDLNEMHEAEKVLTGRREIPPIGQWSDYWQHLISVCYPVLATHATAAQRAEAFLRTIGKWEDDK